MSELQLSLIGLGAAGIAGVWAYNKWQERQQRKTAERVFRGGQADVLLDGSAPAAAPNEPAGRVEPVLAGGGATAEEAATAEPSAAMLDDVVDFVARLEAAEPVAGHVLFEAQRPLAEALGKPLRWIGVDAGGHWRMLGPNDAARYRRLRAGLQLADRQGPVAEADVAAFCDGIAAIAGRITAVADLPPRGDVLSHARAVDGFCASVDIQVAVHVVHRDGQAFPGSTLRGVAEAAGLEWRDDGRFHKGDGAGGTLFTLENLGPQSFAGLAPESLTSHGVTFWIDVPRVADGPAVFEQLLAAARQLAVGLDGVLVDDQRNPLSDAALFGIRSKIAEVQERMAAQGIPAGGARALRLFS